MALHDIAVPNLDAWQRHGRRIAANVGIGFIAGGEKEIETERPERSEALVLLPRWRTGAPDREALRDATAHRVRTALSSADRHANAAGLQRPQVPNLRPRAVLRRHYALSGNSAETESVRFITTQGF